MLVFVFGWLLAIVVLIVLICYFIICDWFTCGIVFGVLDSCVFGLCFGVT